MDDETKKYIDGEIQKWLEAISRNLDAEARKVSMLDQKVLRLEELLEVKIDGFTCPRCGATSYNPNDKRAGYCGRCHDWTGRAPLVDVSELKEP